MENENIINFVILGIIFAIIIHLSFNFFGTDCKENYNIEINVNEESSSQTNNKFIKKTCNNNTIKLNKKIELENFKSNDNIDDHINKKLLKSAKKNNKIYTRQNLEKYRNDFFSFNKKINQSSHNDDMVDKMNELYITGNSNITENFNNMAIKDVYDYLTKN